MDATLSADRVFVAGAGRSGLMMRAFAMRLMHLGLEVYVVGETVTRSLGKGDLLLIGSGSGETRSLVPMAEKARSLQAARNNDAFSGVIHWAPSGFYCEATWGTEGSSRQYSSNGKDDGSTDGLVV